MYNIYIKYIILSLNVDNDKLEYFMLNSNDNSLPSIKLTNDDSIIRARENCIKKHCNLELSWLDDRLLDIESHEDNIYIYYMCRIPIETKIHNGQFIKITTKELLSPIIQKAVRYA